MTNTATTQSPTRKLACHLVRGDIIRNGGRQYRVGHVGLAVAFPRNGGPSRPLYKITLWPARQAGGRSSVVNFERDALVTLVTK